MSISVSLCILRIVECLDEITSDLELDNSGACSESLMATQSSSARARRGRRQPRELRIETYSRNDEEDETPGPPALLPEADGNRRQFSECESTASGASGGVGTCPLGPIPFISGNPYVETTKGLLHLFKQDELTSLEEASTRSQTVCILAIPATMTCSDLLTFTAACHNDIKALRIIRDRVPNQYMALVTFRDSDSALEFYTTFNGAPYSSLDPECCCHLVFVSKVETLSADRPGDAALGPPPSGHTELPLCPVCLERMDESVDGILTILCNHSFHGSCLAKWADISCPVCRYVQTPEIVADNRCLECHSADSLWICLICGHVGCGRYVHGHAYAHYATTEHCYSMQLGNNRVWDYVGDNFVHRLLQNKVDGKLVQGDAQESKESARDEKLDSVQLEFTYLLTSQLESQRLYFEEKFSRLEKQMFDEGSELKNNFQQLSDDNKGLKEKLTQITKEKSVVEKKLQQLTTRLAAVQAELNDERQMSQALRINQTSWQNQMASCKTEKEKLIEEKDKEIAELNDSIRDILFTLEAGREIERSANRDEIIQGQIVVGAPAQPSTSSSRNKKGGPRKGRR